MPSFFLCCKTKTFIWQARKNKRTFIYFLLRKKYVAKYEQILFYETFLRYELETDVNNVMKKKQKIKQNKKKQCL